ncbi:MAG: hypothetical protein AAGA57_01415 [Planctomycetota bacterium]
MPIDPRAASSPIRPPDPQAHWERQLASMHASLLRGRDTAAEALERLAALGGVDEPGPRAEAGRAIADAGRVLAAWRAEHVEECLHALALNRPSSIGLRLAIQLAQAAWDLDEIARHAQQTAEAGPLGSGLGGVAVELREGLLAATDALAHLDPTAGRAALGHLGQAQAAAESSWSGGPAAVRQACGLSGIADRVRAVAQRILETAEGYGDTPEDEPPAPSAGG